MWEPSLPPKPPQQAEQLLSELVAYYQQLADYHQKAAQEAYLRLSHLRVLLGEPKTMSVEAIALEKPPTLASSLKAEEDLLEEEDLPEEVDLLEEEVDLPEEVEAQEQDAVPLSKQAISLKNQKENLLRLFMANQGKILHLDYIQRELNIQLTGEELQSRLAEGEEEFLWASVPDSPNCWTLSLKDIPNLAPKPPKGKSSVPKKKGGIPRREKMKQYKTLTKAVAACLEEVHPKIYNAQMVLDWLYPKGLNPSDAQHVKNSIGKILCKDEGILWKRVKVGKYLWKKPE